VLIGITGATAQDEPLARPAYYEGMLTVMLKEGVNPIPAQQGGVTTGLASLDALVTEHSIQSITKRFKHRPIPRDSDLPDLSRLYRLTFPASLDVQEVVGAFGRDPNVEFAEPIPVAYLADVPDDELYDQLQHLPQIMAAEAWDIHHGEDGASVVVAIVDSGVDYNHPDLTQNVWQNLAEDADGDGHTLELNSSTLVWELDPGDINGLDDDDNGHADDLIGWDFYDLASGQDNDPEDLFGHGTHCAGIAAGVTNNGIGIASISWNLRFMIVKGFDWDDGASGHDAYGAMIYAAENGADVISNSWGTAIYSQAEHMAVEYSAGFDNLIVAAAGNDDSAGISHYPSAYPHVLATASVASTDQKASYSHYGITVDISAPGGDPTDGGITSCVIGGGYEGWQGTSMATPMVAGLLGLVESYQPGWTKQQIATQVFGTADDIDAVNPGYEDLLGSGRINAYRALAETGVTIPQELRVVLLETRVADASGDGMLEPGEVVDLDFSLRNYAHFVGTDYATLTLVTDDPDLIILDGSFDGVIPADDYFDIDDAFSIQIAADAAPHIATMTLQLTADVSVLFGSEMEFSILVAPGGVLVCEGVADGIDYSGAYLRDLLVGLGLPVVYFPQIPTSFAGFDAVFISCGNWGPRLLYGTSPSDPATAAIIDYLEGGGRMYVESGSFLGAYSYFNHPDTELLAELFGVADRATVNQNFIDELVGQTGSLAEGILFTGSEQERCSYIEELLPDSGAATVFSETGYGDVALQNVGSLGQRTVLFSYSLSDLIDIDATSCRSNLVMRIVEFLDLELPGDYLLADFMPSVPGGPPPVVVQFHDLSQADPTAPISSWSWDFDDDDIVDSNDPNPQWTFTQPGYHSVRLVVGNGSETGTLVRGDCVLANGGVLVWDAAPGERDYSGSFIRDELGTLGYPSYHAPVTYASRFPGSLVGFDTVFLSFGNVASNKGILSDVRAAVLLEFLQQGGNLYLEGGDPLGKDQNSNVELRTAFGLMIANNGTDCESVELIGQAESLADGVDFFGTNQVGLGNIDVLVPNEDGVAFSTQTGYYTVGVQHEGAIGQKAVCFSYALAELVDGDRPGTRRDLLRRIMSFFEMPVPVPDEPDVPSTVRLIGNHPNPFNPQTTIAFDLPRRQEVTVAIYDLLGRRVCTLIQGSHDVGRHHVIWNGRDDRDHAVASGPYFIRLATESDVQSRKVMLVK